MPDNLVNHLWRWHHVLGQQHVVEWNGKPVGSTKPDLALVDLAVDGHALDVVLHRRLGRELHPGLALDHRKAIGRKEAENKRAPTVRMPDNLVNHLWRWHHVLTGIRTLRS
jgi:hypothetical protein